MTYLGKWTLKRVLDGYNVQGLPTTKLNQMIQLKGYIVPLDAITGKTKSYKDLMEKGNQNTKSLLIFHKSYRKNLINSQTKVFKLNLLTRER